MTISVCTLAQGRALHLQNLVKGLRFSRRPPGELVVGVMQARRYDLPEASFPIRQVLVGGGDDGGLCLARGRNEAARRAVGDLLVFLDADCIPDPLLLDDYATQASSRAGVLMGEVGYLAKGATDEGVDFTRFHQLAVPHPDRPDPPVDVPAVRAEQTPSIWSLNFAIRARDFAALSGFDERFVGYGAEDSDFIRTVSERHLPAWWVRGAMAFHQYHPHHVPPVHHLDSVLANVRRFEEKWGEPAMVQWLRAFTLMGLIRRDGDEWRKVREPTEADLALTRQQEQQPYASASQVLKWLEERAVRRIGSARGGESSTAAA